MPRRRIETLGAGRHLQLLNDGGWEYAARVRGSGVVAVVAVTEKGELVLTEQYRVPVRQRVIDLPAGLSGDVDGEEDEAQEQAARRELVEETGYEAERFEFVFTGPTSPGLTNEMISFFVARDAVRVNAGGGADGEQIVVHVVPLGRIYTWLRRRESTRRSIDPKVYAALGILAEGRWSGD